MPNQGTGFRWRHIAVCLMIGCGVLCPTTVWGETHETNPSLLGRTIVVDAGHGGPDGGARGVGDIEEKSITLPVSLELVKLLQEAGAHVVCTRETDDDLASEVDKVRKERHRGDLRNRLRVVRHQPVDAFVSIHCNAAHNSSWRGAQVLYLRNHDSSKILATEMQASYKALLLPTSREIQSNATLYLLKRIQSPAVLAEIGFVSNPEEMSALKTKAYQHRVAFASYLALVQYFASDVSSTESHSATIGRLHE
jgi:N-acetylmuramoyl-L-alanine amidase